ncbi:MAG TPA: hypothetical protein VF712_14415 [Thermoleophilaceae bacterium]
MAWVESHSPSFSARHEERDADAAAEMLAQLERFRIRLDDRFEDTPGEISVVMHPGPGALSLAHPWLPLARMATAPAGRRYMAGWFARREIHVLAPDALEARASAVPGSREALLLTPRHEYAHVVIGANNPAFPPPFTPRTFARYLRWAWLCEGAATHLAGQTEHLRPAIARRLREGGRPDFPPAARDAVLLGGTVFAMLDDERGPDACARLAARPPDAGGEAAIESAFGRSPAAVEREWRARLDELRASQPGGGPTARSEYRGRTP